MDLFDDLPPPSAPVKEGGQSLFGNLPPAVGNGSVKEGTGTKRQTDSTSNEDNNQTKKPKKDVYQLKGYFAERQGEREDMQDAHVIIDNVATCQIASPLSSESHRIAYYGVFDGHGGPQASKFAAENLHKNVIAKLPKGDSQHFDRDVKKCLVESFKKTDEEFLSLAAKATPTWKDGSTAVILLVIDNVVFSANLGDSRAFACRRENGVDEKRLSCIPLSKDHNPSNFEERKRIEKNGGIVREGRVMGIVEVSRSIGDGRFKHCGVISTPDIFKCQLTDDVLFLILACDGLWKAFTADEAAMFVRSIVEDETLKPLEDKAVETNFSSSITSNVRGFRFETACNRLAVEAVKRGCTDNVTVMIIDIMSS